MCQTESMHMRVMASYNLQPIQTPRIMDYNDSDYIGKPVLVFTKFAICEVVLVM